MDRLELKNRPQVEDEAEDEEPATHSKKAPSTPKHDDDMSEESEDESPRGGKA